MELDFQALFLFYSVIECRLPPRDAAESAETLKTGSFYCTGRRALLNAD
jgi:hypothetical protein